MLAVQERVRAEDGTTVLVWHKAAQPEQCNGECDFHPIACSDTEGTTAPGPLRDVPLRLKQQDERWCTDCLAGDRVTEE
ncbi:hypothetical protein ACFC5X_19990 [Streptomyces sp. NPDC055952]|uniref:hypothetical protein n=1 Tax=Streptomyces sp. NPDC055952 TaxID=3345663 RepID=UPI0035DF1AA0